MKKFQNTKLLKANYLEQYKKLLVVDLKKAFADLPEKNEEFKDFDYYLASSSAFSSNIEGNSVSFDAFLKYKTFKGLKRTKEIEEIEDLIAAYQFAQKNSLNLKNLLHTHGVLSKKFLIKSSRGKLRKERVGIYGRYGLVYMAIEPEFVNREIKLFFDDISVLFKKKLSIEETFYFAAMIHLIFAKIHPFMDGNGRSARLIEKWFLSKHLGKKAWNIESERYYWENRSAYYEKIHLGANYDEANYDRCVPFLLMLCESLDYKGKPETIVVGKE